jgi:hypothetical protein
MNLEVPQSNLGPAIHPEACAILEKYLAEGESLKWADKPQVRWGRAWKRNWPIFVLVLSIFIFVLTNILNDNARKPEASSAPPAAAQKEPASPQNDAKVPIIMAVFISGFVALFFGLWCYAMFRGLGGQRFLNLFSLSNTYYGLTENRLIMVSGKSEYRVLSCHLRTVQDLRLREDPDGVGTINFGSKDRVIHPFQAEEIPAAMLKNVPQAAQVFKLIFKTQDKLLRP